VLRTSDRLNQLLGEMRSEENIRMNKEAPFRGPLHSVPKGKLDRLNVRGLSALGALHDLELNTLNP
jgi:hypothetical protein